VNHFLIEETSLSSSNQNHNWNYHLEPSVSLIKEDPKAAHNRDHG
jgi:hypothetical protein